MTSTTSQTSLGEYCATRDENIITFATPAYRRRDRFYMAGFFLFFVFFILALDAYSFTGDLGPNPTDQGHMMLIGVALPFLLMAAGMYLSTGVNTVVFDLERRTYKRMVYAENSFDLDSAGRIYGLGNPFRRRTLDGNMSEIRGVQIVEQRMGGGKAPRSSGYTITLVWLSHAEPAMIVGFARSEDEAWDIAVAISEALNLPVLQIDRANSWATLARETRLQTTSPVPVNILSPSRPHSSSQKIEGFLPAATRRKTLPRNVYLTQFDGKTAVFRRPVGQVALNLSIGAFFYAIPIVLTILHLERWKTYDVPTLIMAVPLVLLGSILIFSSGRSEIAFDLEQRTYRRWLLPKFPGMTEDIVGGGLPFGSKVVTGSMNEIEGMKVLVRETSDYSHCAVRLIWAGNAQPPCVVYYTRNRQDAHLQALEIGSLLGLPIIPLRMPVTEPEVSITPKQYNRW